MNPVLAFLFQCGAAIASGVIVGTTGTICVLTVAEWVVRRVWFRVRQRFGMCRNRFQS